MFEATVIGFEVSTDPSLKGVANVRLSDVRVITGAAPRALIQLGSSCDVVFAMNVRYRIEGEPAAHGTVQASQCGATRPVWTWDCAPGPPWRRGGGSAEAAEDSRPTPVFDAVYVSDVYCVPVC